MHDARNFQVWEGLDEPSGSVQTAYGKARNSWVFYLATFHVKHLPLKRVSPASGEVKRQIKGRVHGARRLCRGWSRPFHQPRQKQRRHSFVRQREL